MRRITTLRENEQRRSKFYTHTVSYKLRTLHWEATTTTQYLPDRLESRATLAATRVRMRVASSRGRRGSALQPFGQKDCLRNIQWLYNHSCTAYCNMARYYFCFLFIPQPNMVYVVFGLHILLQVRDMITHSLSTPLYNYYILHVLLRCTYSYMQLVAGFPVLHVNSTNMEYCNWDTRTVLFLKGPMSHSWPKARHFEFLELCFISLHNFWNGIKPPHILPDSMFKSLLL